MCLRLAEVEAAGHLPFPDIKLPLGATIQTRAVSAAVAGEGTAHLCVPASKHSRHEAADSIGDRRSMVHGCNSRIADGYGRIGDV